MQRNPDSETGKFLLLESGIQLKESGILLISGVRNTIPPTENTESSTWIQNPWHGIQNPRVYWIQAIPTNRLCFQNS